MAVNRQRVIVYNSPVDGEARVYATAYNDRQAGDGIEACAARHGRKSRARARAA